jgi:hypothetical protein
MIFPLLPEHTRRFFEDGKTVFVKFFGKGSNPQRLRIGSRLFFYESERNKEVVGEAKIVEINSETADTVLTKYGHTLFLTPAELDEYAKQRREKKMLVLVLKGAKRYKTPLKLKKSVTMAGQYMTAQMHESMIRSMRRP